MDEVQMPLPVTKVLSDPVSLEYIQRHPWLVACRLWRWRRDFVSHRAFFGGCWHLLSSLSIGLLRRKFMETERGLKGRRKCMCGLESKNICLTSSR